MLFWNILAYVGSRQPLLIETVQRQNGEKLGKKTKKNLMECDPRPVGGTHLFLDMEDISIQLFLGTH